jgi:hypothetical protein
MKPALSREVEVIMLAYWLAGEHHPGGVNVRSGREGRDGQ